MFLIDGGHMKPDMTRCCYQQQEFDLTETKKELCILDLYLLSVKTTSN